MPLTRRQFSAAALAAAAPLTPVAALRAFAGFLQENPVGPARGELFDWKPLPTAGAHVAFEQGGNVLALTSKDRTLLVDTKNAGFGRRLRAEVAAKGPAVTTVVNTHHHADHTGGNSAFSDLGVISHENCAPRVRRQFERYKAAIRAAARGIEDATSIAAQQTKRQLSETLETLHELTADDFTPSRPVGADQKITIGDLEVSLFHVGNGHTDNDLVIHVPQLDLLHAGDLMFHRLHPYVDKGAGADTRGWQDSLRAILDRIGPDTVVIPGHGAITDISGVRAQIEYFDIMRETVRTAIDNGMDRDEVVDIVAPADLKEYGFERLMPIALGAIYDELTAA